MGSSSCAHYRHKTIKTRLWMWSRGACSSRYCDSTPSWGFAICFVYSIFIQWDQWDLQRRCTKKSGPFKQRYNQPLSLLTQMIGTIASVHLDYSIYRNKFGSSIFRPVTINPFGATRGPSVFVDVAKPTQTTYCWDRNAKFKNADGSFIPADEVD